MKYERLTDRETAEMLKNTEGASWDSDLAEAQRYIRLAELEDKIENGLLCELPFKDWDNAYFIAQDGSGKPYVLSTHHWEWVVFARICGKSYMSMSDDQIFEYGEDVFSTKEEAERQIANLFGRY